MKIEKLEAIRGGAALYVVIHHLFGFTPLSSLLGPIVRFPFRFGQESVILFFLLSGFVIYLSVHKIKELDFRIYFIKRLRRIYPIAIASILLSIVVAKLNGNSVGNKDYLDLIGNLFMLQDLDAKPGLWFGTFLNNFPLWSLSYEWYFYMLFFPLYQILPKNQFRIYLILFLSLVSWLTYLLFPNHLSLILSYLILWWAGLESAVVFVRDRKFTYQNMKHILGCLFIMSLAAAIPLVDAMSNGFRDYHYQADPILYPIVVFRHFIFGFICLLLGLLWWRVKLVGFSLLLQPFAAIAPISYGLYLMHFPIILLNLSPLLHNANLEIIAKIVLMVWLSYLVELKLQPLVNKFIR
jgi:peptidoglycan/LPS O-acetylase OafA/YrhL